MTQTSGGLAGQVRAEGARLRRPDEDEDGTGGFGDTGPSDGWSAGAALLTILGPQGAPTGPAGAAAILASLDGPMSMGQFQGAVAAAEAAGIDRGAFQARAMADGPLSRLSTGLVNRYLDAMGYVSAAAGGAGSGGAAGGGSGFLAEGEAGPAGCVAVDAAARDGNGAALLAQLQALGLQGGAAIGNMAGGWLPVSAIGALLDLQNIQFIQDAAGGSSAGTVTTQADVAQRNDYARQYASVDGTGYRIGILSTSFDTNASASDHYAQNRLNFDLPYEAASSVILTDNPNDSDEGRAMGQLVHDLAPGALLRFSTAAGGFTAYAQHIRDLATAGCRIIVDDYYYVTDLAYQDGIIAQAVDAVTAQGALYFSSAGNTAQQAYGATWNSAPNTFSYGGTTYTAHRFTGGSAVSDTLVPIQLGGDLLITLQWDQPSASAGGRGANSDLDLFLTDASGNVLNYSNGTPIVATANNIGGDATEFIRNVNGSGTAYIRVGYHARAGDAGAPGNIRVFVNRRGGTFGTSPFAGLASNTNDGTVYGHNSAQGAIAVGAASYAQTPQYRVSPPRLENFSSVGNTTVLFDTAGNRLATGSVRNGVAFTAVDGGNTTFFGQDDGDADTSPNFFGTSAAAPDAAATAALMLQANPNLTRDDVLHILQTSSLDMDNPYTTGFDTGPDRASGYGLIQADLAVRYGLYGQITDSLFGEAPHPVLLGRHLDDRFSIVTDTPHTINGYEGTDLLDYTAFNGGVQINLPEPGYVGYGYHGPTGATDTLLSIEQAYGGDGNDRIYGSSINNYIYGGTGADTLLGNGGNDEIYGAAGDDVIQGGTGLDTADFGGNRSTATITRNGNGSVTVVSTDGTDTLIGIERLLFRDATVSIADPAREDTTGDGTSDIILQAGGTIVDWIIRGGTYQSGNSLSTTATGYTVVGTGDVNLDGVSDLILQNGGTVVDWIMGGGRYQSGNVLANAGGYVVRAVGDLTGDGTADLVLQQGDTVVEWTLANGAYAGGRVLANAGGYTVVGAGDFDGDGDADLLLQNGGTVVEWLIQNGGYQSGRVLTTAATGYAVVGTGDFNGDGTDDILLQNGGTVVDWIMGGGQYQAGNVLTANSGGFSVRAVGDYNGDGTDDIALQAGTGTVVQWTIRNGLYQAGTTLGDAGGFRVV